MNFAQPIFPVSFPSLVHSSVPVSIVQYRLTPISTLPPEIFPHVRHKEYRQQQFELLYALLPFFFRVGFFDFELAVIGVVYVVAGGGVGERVQVIWGGGRG